MLGQVKKCFTFGGNLPTLTGASRREIAELQEGVGQFARQVCDRLPAEMLTELSDFMVEIAAALD